MRKPGVEHEAYKACDGNTHHDDINRPPDVHLMAPGNLLLWLIAAFHMLLLAACLPPF